MLRRVISSQAFFRLPLQFSFATKAQQKTLEHQWTTKNPYTPVRPIQYTKGTYIVFDQPKKTVLQVPYEIKETGVRNTIGLIVSEIASYMFLKLSPLSTIFVANFAIQVLWRMSKAIMKVELLEGGKKVRMTKKTGGTFVADINKIQKLRDEALLLATFAEPYLYPIEVTNDKGRVKKYYLYGQGFLPIKNGEVFRAIINGKELVNEVGATESKN